jgi:hypothetical protein
MHAQHRIAALLGQHELGRRFRVEFVELSGADSDKLLLHYPAVKRGTGYVAPVVTMEFGGRATGEPHSTMPVTCDIEGQVDGVSFPAASPMVMSVTRTFWEKATAAHVYCAQGRIRGERYARHWHDLAAIMRSPHFDSAIKDREVARAVAEHKSHFFSEKDAAGHTVDYFAAIAGSLQVVPEGAAREALAADYAGMLENQVMVGDALPFEDLMAAWWHPGRTRPPGLEQSVAWMATAGLGACTGAWPHGSSCPAGTSPSLDAPRMRGLMAKALPESSHFNLPPASMMAKILRAEP